MANDIKKEVPVAQNENIEMNSEGQNKKRVWFPKLTPNQFFIFVSVACVLALLFLFNVVIHIDKSISHSVNIDEKTDFPVLIIATITLLAAIITVWISWLIKTEAEEIGNKITDTTNKTNSRLVAQKTVDNSLDRIKNQLSICLNAAARRVECLPENIKITPLNKLVTLPPTEVYKGTKECLRSIFYQLRVNDDFIQVLKKLNDTLPADSETADSETAVSDCENKKTNNKKTDNSSDKYLNEFYKIYLNEGEIDDIKKNIKQCLALHLDQENSDENLFVKMDEELTKKFKAWVFTSSNLEDIVNSQVKSLIKIYRYLKMDTDNYVALSLASFVVDTSEESSKTS